LGGTLKMLVDERTDRGTLEKKNTFASE